MENILRISDLTTTEVLYYDPEFKDKCYKFCERRNIDCLPCLDDTSNIFIRDDSIKGFRAEHFQKERMIDASINAFHLSVLEMLSKNHLLLVGNIDGFVGVIHFSDFNKPIVSNYLYDLFHRYERSLRTMFKLLDKDNSHILDFIDEKAKTQKIEKSEIDWANKKNRYSKTRFQQRLEEQPVFQPFYLDDLIGFANFIGNTLSLEVVNLRNMIMHSHELVNKENWQSKDYIFDFPSFQQFFQLSLRLQSDYKRVKNKVAFLKGLDERVVFE